MNLRLAGRRVLVTRSARQASRLSEELRALGAIPVEVPVIEIVPPESYAPLDDALRNLDRYDWLILTSANAARALSERATHLGVNLQRAATLQVAAVGPATAAEAQKTGLTVALVPDSYVAESLIEKLLAGKHAVSAQAAAGSTDEPVVKGHGFSRAEAAEEGVGALDPEGSLRGQSILLVRAAVARDVIPAALRAAGARVDVIEAYRNVLPKAAPEKLRLALEQEIDAATFTSSSSVTHLKEAADKAGIAFPFAGVRAISIGPITSETLRQQGWEPAIEANPSDIPGLVSAICKSLSAS